MRFRRLAALLAAVVVALWTAPPGACDPAAEPAPGAPEPAAGTALSLTDLGANPTISFGRVNQDNATASVTFAVPPGMAPVALRARADLPVNLRFGTLTVNQGDRTISRVGLPQDGAGVVVPLPGLRPSGNLVTLNLRLVALSQDPYCWDNDAPVRLADASVDFAGAEAPPRSVAEFLPPVLRRVVVALPAQPSLAESTAAVRVATAVAGRNSQRIEVAVLPLPDGRTALDLPPAPMERQIVVREGPEKGLSLQDGPGMPTLLVTGRADELPEQVRLLGDPMVRFAAAGRSTAGPLLEDRLLAATTTLQEMNSSGVSGQNSVGFDINQTRFGEPLRNVRVHLIGSYTPLPGTVGGEVTAAVNGEVVGRWPATADGTIDATVAIPDRLLRRSMNLQVGVRGAGEQGQCSRITTQIRLDGRTEIRTDGANPAVPQGFQSLPQALMPSVRIGIGPDAFGDTARAARIMVGFQRVSAAPLLSQVMTVETALAGGGSAVLVSAGGWSQPSVALPFSVGGNQVTVAGTDAGGQAETLTLDRDTPFGSLQTVFDGPRALLVATSNGDPRALDGLLDWLAAERGRWAELDGRAVVAVPGTDPVIVENPAPAAAPSAGLSLPDGGTSTWWIAGGAAAAVALAAVFGALRWRRGRSG